MERRVQLMKDQSVLQFYDRLADNYHLIFADWGQAVTRQGQILAQIIQAEGFSPPASLLDCACGIGTQAIGLAGQGYRVFATDLSPAAVARAAGEAVAFNVSIATGVADMRSLARQVTGPFKIVIACDNALPHLLSLAELAQAVRNIKAVLEPGGLFLASIRDYDRLLADRPGATTPVVYSSDEGRRISFQVWDWASGGPTYTVTQFLLQERDGQWQTDSYQTEYWALLRAELSQLLLAEGFEDVRWLLPAETDYYQPVVTARLRAKSGGNNDV